MNEAELRNGIDKIIRNNDIDTAIHNLKGYMRLRYGHSFLCENLANLYIEKNDFVRLESIFSIKSIYPNRIKKYYPFTLHILEMIRSIF